MHLLLGGCGCWGWCHGISTAVVSTCSSFCCGHTRSVCTGTPGGAAARGLYEKSLWLMLLSAAALINRSYCRADQLGWVGESAA